VVEAYGIRNEEGWVGAFTRAQADGAIPNGTPIVKVRTEAGDAHGIGARGVVLGSLRAPGRPEIMYFIEWADRARVASGTIDWKISPLQQ
jgi:hypothetical protein